LKIDNSRIILMQRELSFAVGPPAGRAGILT